MRVSSRAMNIGWSPVRLKGRGLDKRNRFTENLVKKSDEQNSIITAPIGAHIYVEAEPGTGKTAVACARVVRIINEEQVPASSILMISFTRTAVAEMKSRITQSIPVSEATAINIATLDQTAFSFGIGCGEEFKELMGSFDGNIEQAIQHLEKRNPVLLDYLSRLNHIIIDEAQDITGSRARLVTLLLTVLPKRVGVTIFADRGQAIYGFATDIDDIGAVEKSFIKIFDFVKNGYCCTGLTEIHRTDDINLLHLFKNTRMAVFEPADNSYRAAAVIAQIKKHGESQGSEVQQLPLKGGDLVLFRKRAAALMASQFCPDIFRLRLPGYPAAVFPWIGIMLGDWTKPLMNQSEFTAAWKKVPDSFHNGFDNDRAWNLLMHFAGSPKGKDLDLKRLRGIVSRPRPPVEFCYLDYGGNGPIFSTIHASKGREADRVFLMLPRNTDDLEQANGGGIDLDEEARVFYVGATRVKKEFFHGVALTMVGAGRLDDSGRRVVEVLSLKKKPKFQFGLSGDIDETAVISRIPGMCATQKQAAKNQQGLIALWTTALRNEHPPKVFGNLGCVEINGEKKYTYTFISENRTIAWAGDGLFKDLWATANKLQAKAHCSKLRPPDDLELLRLIGLRTCAIAPNSAYEGAIHEPFASSGFFLAPMIVGFPSVFFVFQKHH
jgi:AAA domain/UvrD-like helicase C-terminal domain